MDSCSDEGCAPTTPTVSPSLSRNAFRSRRLEFLAPYGLWYTCPLTVKTPLMAPGRPNPSLRPMGDQRMPTTRSSTSATSPAGPASAGHKRCTAAEKAMVFPRFIPAHLGQFAGQLLEQLLDLVERGLQRLTLFVREGFTVLVCH